MEMTLAENMILKSSFNSKWQKRFFLDRSRIRHYAKSNIEAYSIKTPGPDAVVKGSVRRQPAESDRCARGGQGHEAYRLRSAHSGP